MRYRPEVESNFSVVVVSIGSTGLRLSSTASQTWFAKHPGRSSSPQMIHTSAAG